MISISRREAFYTAGLFAACALALVLPRHPLFELFPPLIAICCGCGALAYLLRAVTRPITDPLLEASEDTGRPR